MTAFFKDKYALTALAFTLTICFLCAAVSLYRPVESFSRARDLRAAIKMKNYADTARGLVTGYNYHLLERFAEDRNSQMEIVLGADSEDWLDSLLNGRIDIVVVPEQDSLPAEGLCRSISIDGISRWITRDSDSGLAKVLDSWLEESLASPGLEDVREQFLHTYIPHKRARTGIKYEYLSPYDQIIKANADSIGWDWRLLAAVVYQESKFKIDARSRRGAEGLMQMMPRTASHLELEDAVNPALSIAAGAKYLKTLEGLYSSVTPFPEERCKYTLAAYNAGQGRIRDCINLARLRGKDIRYWDETASVIPEMGDESILAVDTVKLGIFKGFETQAYIRSVLSVYESFRQICP